MANKPLLEAPQFHTSIQFQAERNPSAYSQGLIGFE